MRFVRRKRFLSMDLSDFIAAGVKISSLVDRHVQSFDIRVLSCEDPFSYHASKYTIPSSAAERLMERRAVYTLDELSYDVSDRSFKMELFVYPKGEGVDPSAMIAVTWDLTAEHSRFRFYLQTLPTPVEEAVRKEFCKNSFFWRVVQ